MGTDAVVLPAELAAANPQADTLDADTALMLRFQAGEEACFDALVERYRRPLLGFVFRMLRDQGASEELLQEAFLRVYLHRDRYRPQAAFRTWMYRIAYRLALNHVRDHRKERRHDSLDQPESLVGAMLADPRLNPEQELLAVNEALRRQQRIRTAIAALPVRQRTAVVLHRYQGLEYEEIGAILRLSSSATKSLLFRAYETLRRELKDLL
ncbi:MAG TPA: sigma-70 family RNA polymerase sigma factor [Terriglobales bacterium]|nr:sigma-70 family RNA polymerase sigma factor [Terriglobales bacterium]